MGLKHNDSCLAKAAPDEPIFVLRAKDKTAPNLVRAWAVNAASLGTPYEKTRETREPAEAMEHWQKENGCKVPD